MKQCTKCEKVVGQLGVETVVSSRGFVYSDPAPSPWTMLDLPPWYCPECSPANG